MRKKVFVIGFHKTGTTSFENLLEEIGYRVYGGDKKLLKIGSDDERREYIKRLLNHWDAVQDMPWPLFYKELHDLFPDAKFILTYRDPEDWYFSVQRYFGSIRIPLHKRI